VHTAWQAAALGDAARVLELAVSPLLGATYTLTPTTQAEVSRAVEALRCQARIQGI